jgi:hypothetical protein
LNWLSKKCAVSSQSKEPLDRVDNELAKPDKADPPKGDGLKSFNSVADVFAKAAPQTDSEKALVVAAYLQEMHEKAELTGFELNKELNHRGHGPRNITMSVQQLIDKRPQLWPKAQGWRARAYLG